MAKKQLNEVLGLDRIMKYVLVGFFGPKVIDAANKRKVLRDPKIRKRINDIHSDLKDLRNDIADITQRQRDIIDKAIAKNIK